MTVPSDMASEVDIYLPEIIDSLEETLGGHDVSLTALTEAHEDLFRLVQRILGEITSMRAEMSSGARVGTSMDVACEAEAGAHSDGYVSEPLPDVDAEDAAVVSDGRGISPELGGGSVGSGSNVLDESEKSSDEDHDAKGKAADVKSSTTGRKSGTSRRIVRGEDIEDLYVESRASSPQVVSTVKRRLSKRRPARQCEDDQEGNQVTETFSSHLVNAEKKRTSIHVDADQSDEDGDKTQQRTSGMTPSKKNNRPRPRPVGRKRARADEDVPHSGSMTSRSTKARKTSSSANVERMLRETPAAGSSKSVNKRDRSPYSATYRTASEASEEEEKATSPAHSRRRPMSKDRAEKFKNLKSFKEFVKDQKSKWLKKDKA